jgi:glycosyltransferase involved in cell wall biosynthesis
LQIVTIIPTYNEVENIKILIPKILEIFKEETIDGEIIIVDDNSPDGTGQVAEDLAKGSDKILVLRRLGKMGLGSAYKAAQDPILRIVVLRLMTLSDKLLSELTEVQAAMDERG